jgi:hypothetical protein
MLSKKSKTNFFINGAMFFLMSFMTSSGLLMKFVLIPGSQRQEKLGRNVDLFLLGMDRHDWGTVHLVVGCVLIGLFAVHIALHWREVTGIFSKLVSSRGLSTLICWTFALACALLLILPFILEPTSVERGPGAGMGAGWGQMQRAR